MERRYELQEFRQAIGRFVSGLSETEQKVFVARFGYLSPVEEIARRLQISSSKTNSMLFRLRTRLRLDLKEEDRWWARFFSCAPWTGLGIGSCC